MKKIDKVSKFDWFGLVAMGLSVASMLLSQFVQDKKQEAQITCEVDRALKSRDK